MKKKNIFICCTEQSGENICYNILKRLDLKNLNIDGVCGSRSEQYINIKYFDISEFKSIGLVEILFSIRKYIKMINFLKKILIKSDNSKKIDARVWIQLALLNKNLKSLKY